MRSKPQHILSDEGIVLGSGSGFKNSRLPSGKHRWIPKSDGLEDDFPFPKGWFLGSNVCFRGWEWLGNRVLTPIHHSCIWWENIPLTIQLSKSATGNHLKLSIGRNALRILGDLSCLSHVNEVLETWTLEHPRSQNRTLDGDILKVLQDGKKQINWNDTVDDSEIRHTT